jgi:hypothetical protein
VAKCLTFIDILVLDRYQTLVNIIDKKSLLDGVIVGGAGVNHIKIKRGHGSAVKHGTHTSDH